MSRVFDPASRVKGGQNGHRDLAAMRYPHGMGERVVGGQWDPVVAAADVNEALGVGTEEDLERGRTFARAGLLAGIAAKFGSLVEFITASAVLAKFAKIWLTLATMTASVVAYAFTLGGWWFAVGLVGMIFVHEMGHVWAMRREGMKTKAPVFIPLVGAVIFAPEMGSREQEARIGYAGPLVGSLAAFLVFLIALTTSGGLRTGLLIASYLGVLINLFNLIIPIRPLDGGRVTQIVGDWFKYVGLAVLLALILLSQARGLLLILVLVLIELKWHPTFKATAATTIFMALAVMIAFGLGQQQPFLYDLFDLGLVGVLTAITVQEALDGDEENVIQSDKPNTTSWPIRLKWLALYLGLTVALIGFLLLNQSLLPAHVTGL